MGDRYAQALFDLARDGGQLDTVAADLDRVAALLDESPELRRFAKSPLRRPDEQERAVTALLSAAGLTGVVANFTRLVARNGRLFSLGAAIAAFRKLLAQERGETPVSVVSAAALTPEQAGRLADRLSSVLGRRARVDARVDPGLLGGLVIQVGSRQIDGSLKTKLDRLAVAMKGNA